ncbi:class F sortase [Micromonospora sp. CPCC 206060]|uniref:class F sortase n=1 Tax=Micromonospora sp. CPCC 206060 TaxID=3122406 RepID=UPI002FF36120
MVAGPPPTAPDVRRAGGRERTWPAPVAVLLVLAGIFATGAGLGRVASGPWDWLAAGRDAGGATERGPHQPVSLHIDAIGVTAPVHRVGLAPDGSIAVPTLERHRETGWYDRGPTPGQDGPAIIVGHSDTRDGPSVFYDLNRLRPGARIEVTRADRSVVVFRVDSVERFDKQQLPADRVYGDYRRPGLRLITCGGRWVGGSIGYADNVVVFASLVEARDP